MSSSDSDDVIYSSQQIDPELLATREEASQCFNDSQEDILLQVSQILDPDSPSKRDIDTEYPIYESPGASFDMGDVLLSPEEGTIETETPIDLPGRFVQAFNDDDVEKLSKTATPANTLRWNAWAVKIFQKWSDWRNTSHVASESDKYSQVKDLLLLETEELAYWLSKLVLEVRKVNGDEYPPKTLMHLVMGLQSHIRLEKKLQLNILNSPEFEEFRQLFDGHLKQLTERGLGSKPKQAQVVSFDEEELFWSSNLLGDNSPKVLLRTMVILNGKNFALRSGREHRNLRFANSQIELIEPKNDRPFLKYTEDSSKNRQGGIKHMKIEKKVVIQHSNPNNAERCHVAIFKKYLSKCPLENKQNAFYLTPLQKAKDDIWYSVQPVGVNTLSKMTSELYKEAGIGGHHTNHSWRATAATRLYERGIDEQLIMQRTGHLSVEGVRSYKRTTDEQRQMVSDVLNESQPPAKRYRSSGSSETTTSSTSEPIIVPTTSHSNPDHKGPVNINLQNCSVTFQRY